MQMAKRVSLSRPCGLNRERPQKEPLGSQSSPLHIDRMCRSGRSDAPRPAYGPRMLATCHRGSTVSPHLNSQLDRPRS
jgi:hypothetical protein